MMKTRSFLIAGGIGSILIIAAPLACLILTIVYMAILVAPVFILLRWFFIQIPILFLVGGIYAASDRASIGSKEARSSVPGASLTSFCVGLVGAISEILARAIPDILVTVHLMKQNYMHFGFGLFLMLAAGFFGLAIIGAGFGAAGAATYGALLKQRKTKIATGKLEGTAS